MLMLTMIAVGIALYLYAGDQFKNANLTIKYIGLVVAYAFSFICAD